MFSNYKRMFKFAIYSVYMYLFFKRFVYVLRYFKDLTVACLKAYVSMLKRVFKFIFLAPKTSLENLIKSYDFGFLNSLKRLMDQVMAKLAQSTKPIRRPKFKTFVLSLLAQIFKVLSFLYNTFILVQLSCIGYAESFRIKRALLHVINQNKHIRVHDRKS